MALSTIKTASIANDAVTADKIINDGNLGVRNLIINGAMQVAQRGSSHTTEGYGSLDRYYLALSGASGVTMSQQAFSTADRNSLGFEKYLKLAVTTANNNCGVYQNIEASNVVHLIGSKATLSFYAKGTNPAGGSFTMQPAWYNTSSGGGDNAVAQSLTVTSSWVKYSFTFDIPAPANTTIDNSAYLSISFTQPAADTSTTAWELNLAGLQFELGEEATPFEHRSFANELHSCKRFYQKSFVYSQPPVNSSNTTSNSYNGAMGGYCGSNNSGIYSGGIQLDPPMRATPTMTTYGNSNGHWGQLIPTNTGTISYSAGAGYIGHIRENGFTVGQNISGNVLMIGFGQWTAEAEL